MGIESQKYHEQVMAMDYMIDLLCSYSKLQSEEFNSVAGLLYVHNITDTGFYERGAAIRKEIVIWYERYRELGGHEIEMIEKMKQD